MLMRLPALRCPDLSLSADYTLTWIDAGTVTVSCLDGMTFTDGRPSKTVTCIRGEWSDGTISECVGEWHRAGFQRLMIVPLILVCIHTPSDSAIL